LTVKDDVFLRGSIGFYKTSVYSLYISIGVLLTGLQYLFRRKKELVFCTLGRLKNKIRKQSKDLYLPRRLPITRVVIAAKEIYIRTINITSNSAYVVLT
jgi:hypothetical protein